MNSYCGLDCKKCEAYKVCKGCNKCDGHPMGGNCCVANYIKKYSLAKYELMKKELVNKINDLDIKGLIIDDLNLVRGDFVNIEYKLDNKAKVKFLNDNDVYLANQVCVGKKCYGVVTDSKFILIASYGENGTNPKLVYYSKNK